MRCNKTYRTCKLWLKTFQQLLPKIFHPGKHVNILQLGSITYTQVGGRSHVEEEGKKLHQVFKRSRSTDLGDSSANEENKQVAARLGEQLNGLLKRGEIKGGDKERLQDLKQMVGQYAKGNPGADTHG